MNWFQKALQALGFVSNLEAQLEAFNAHAVGETAEIKPDKNHTIEISEHSEHWKLQSSVWIRVK